MMQSCNNKWRVERPKYETKQPTEYSDPQKLDFLGEILYLSFLYSQNILNQAYRRYLVFRMQCQE